MEPLVQINGLSRRFGSKLALDNVDFEVPAGSVTGLVGENGAGKTTLIKHVLGLYRAQQGTVRVFGLDPVADPAAVLARVGYLSEEADVPLWMRVGELLVYARSFYKTWDQAYAETLLRDFKLDSGSKLSKLSKGQRARAGLLIALAYRPPLLVLDEPSSGLDPIVRKDILGAIIRTIAEEGRSVLFSSHLLEEVERVSDRVAMIKDGRILFCGELDEVKDRHRRVVFRFEEPRDTPPQVEGAFAWQGGGREWSALCDAPPPHLEAIAATIDARIVDHCSSSLDEIFVARAASVAS